MRPDAPDAPGGPDLEGPALATPRLAPLSQLLGTGINFGAAGEGMGGGVAEAPLRMGTAASRGAAFVDAAPPERVCSISLLDPGGAF